MPTDTPKRDDYKPRLPDTMDPADIDCPLPSEWNRADEASEYLDGWYQTMVNILFGTGAKNTVLMLADVIRRENRECYDPAGEEMLGSLLNLPEELERLVQDGE